MSSNSPPPTAEQRAQAIVEDVIARRRRGELVLDEEVLRDHPELLGPLEKLLRRASFVEAIRDHSSHRHPAMSMDSLLESLEEESESLDEAPEGRPKPQEMPAQLLATYNAKQPPLSRRGRRRSTIDESDQEPDRLIMAEHSAAEHSAEHSAEEQKHSTLLVPAEADPAEEARQDPPDAAVEPGNPIDSSEKQDGPSTTIRCDPRPGVDQTARYRPPTRPPMAVLHVFDDGQSTFEECRLRMDRTTIGRELGEVVIPHDSLMSAEHAAIEREMAAGSWRWTLRDLDSTNGVYVKVRRVRLRDGEQLLIANRTVYFSQGKDGQPPALLELRPEGEGERLVLEGTATDYWIGRDRSVCSPFLSSEPSLDNRFARLLRRDDGRWTMWASPSLNGLWVAVDHVRLVSGGMFQLGEQRFAFHLP